MLEQVKSLLALLRGKNPPWLLVAATVLSIAASVLVQLAGVGETSHTTTVIERPPAPVAAKVAKLDLTPASCPEPAQLGQCLQATAPHSLLAGAASVRTIAGPKGPDVSSYQPNSNWVQVKAAGYRFAFVKATEGRGYVNPYFARDWRELARLKVAHGAYDFARPQPGWSGADEARHFYAIVHSAGGFHSLPPVLDVEASVLSASATRAWVGQFVHEIRALTGRKAVTIYTGAWFWDPHVGGQTFGTHLWVSGYANSVTLPHGWSHAAFWQFTDGTYGPFPHVVPGIGKVDISVYQGHDLAALAQAKPKPSKADVARARKLKVWRRHHRIAHAKLHACGAHRAHAGASFYCRHYRARNRRLHGLIARR